jgi:hypothetical protein
LRPAHTRGARIGPIWGMPVSCSPTLTMDGDPCEKSKIGNCETDSPKANGDDEEVEGQIWRDYIDQGQKDGDQNKHFHLPFFGFIQSE